MQVLDVKVPGAVCEIPVRVYQASADAPSQLLVYFHGGGFVMGSIKSHDAVCRRLARYSQVLRGIHNWLLTLGMGPHTIALSTDFPARIYGR